MEVFSFEVVEGQQWVLPARDDHFENFATIDGREIRDWRPPLMRLVAVNRRIGSYSDFPWLGEHAPLLRKRAVDAVGALLLTYGQLLPTVGEEVHVFNCTHVLDSLDHEQSSISFFDDGSILDIRRHVFHPDVVGTSDVFKLPLVQSPVYVTDAFVQLVRDAGLEGVSFRRLWIGD